MCIRDSARPVRLGLRLIERPGRRHHRRREPLRPRHRLAHRGQGLAHNRGSSYQDLDNRCFTSNSWALVAGNSPPTQTSRLEFGGCRPIVGPRLIVRNAELRSRARSAPTTPTSKPPSAPCSSNRLPATNSWPTPVVRNAELRSPQARAKTPHRCCTDRPITADPAFRISPLYAEYLETVDWTSAPALAGPRQSPALTRPTTANRRNHARTPKKQQKPQKRTPNDPLA